MKKGRETSEQLRTRIIKQSDRDSTKSRLGLFSMPVPLAIGADTYKSKKANKDVDGRVVIGKRGIYTGCEKTGTLPKSLFDGVGLLTNGKYPDPYVSKKLVFRSQRGNSLKTKKKLPKLQRKASLRKKDPFYLTTSKWGMYKVGRANKLGSPFEFFSRRTRHVPKKIKDDDGRVIIGTSNILGFLFSSNLLIIV